MDCKPCLLLLFLLSHGAQAQRTNCYNGQILNGTCVCYPGFSGNKCQDCVGRFIVGDREGTITNGPDVAHFSNCMAIIKPPIGANETLHIRFDYTMPSCRCDYLTVYEGDSIHGPILATFNGAVLPTRPPEVLSSSGVATLQFHNDGKIFFEEGYKISYWLEKNECVLPCEVDGGEEPDINCKGPWCSYAWTNTANQGRASAGTAAIDEFLYVFGGKAFGNVSVQAELLRLNMSSFLWEIVTASSKAPEMRHDHTLVVWKHSLLMYGGIFANGTIVNEFWKFDVNTSEWILLPTNSTFADESPPLIGHSSHVTSYADGTDIMLLFFGFNPLWLINPHVFQLNLETNEISRVKTKGALPIPTYGHSSTADPKRKVIYIHGGYNLNVYSHLYLYNVEEKTWSTLPSSPYSSFLHTMAVLDGSLFLFGGQGQVPNLDRCEICGSVPATSYDINCKEWIIIPEDSLIAGPRYGHSVTQLSEGTILLYAGYDGTMKSEIITFTAEKSSFCISLNQSACSKDSSCQWSGTKCEANTFCQKNETLVCEEICSSFYSCEDCKSSPCDCCYDNIASVCFSGNETQCKTEDSCDDHLREVEYCSQMDTCASCQSSGCVWDGMEAFCKVKQNNSSPWQCAKGCSMMSSCFECTEQSGCSWCSSSKTCLPQGTASIYYPYGGCADYITSTSQCEMDRCLKYQSCDECVDDDACGWCDFGSDTGYGSCTGGYLHGSMSEYCPQQQWNFVICPECQCNGHSTCTEEQPDVCNSCDVGTTGPTCGECDILYFGTSTNGRNCSECECNNHASRCSNDGSCYCDVMGVVGRNCESCSSVLGFHGDAVNDTCFYTIDVMNKYFFPIDSYEMVNFESCPSKKGTVTVKMQTDMNNSPFNATISTNATDAKETVYITVSNITDGEVSLMQKDFGFGEKNRRCIRIYIEGAQNKIVVSLVQSQSTILELIAVFLVSLLILIVLLGIGWKTNEVILARRRMQFDKVERERLAARPIFCVNFHVQEEKTRFSIHDYQRSISCSTDNEKPCAIAEEICQSSEAAVNTTFLSLPMQSGYSSTRLVLGSFLASKLKHSEGYLRIEEKPKGKTAEGLLGRFSRRFRTVHPTGIDNMSYYLSEDT